MTADDQAHYVVVTNGLSMSVLKNYEQSLGF